MDVVFRERSATGVALLKSMRVSGERTRMLTAGSRPITVESRVDETITRHPSTCPIFVQGGCLHVTRSGQLYATDPGLTLGEYAALNGLAVERLL
jgi:hypothetical protein